MPKKSPPTRKLTRKQKRDLDIEIQFLEGVAQRDPGYTDVLRILADDYTRRGRITDGLRMDERVVKLVPGDALAHYNLACSYSLTERLDLAMLALEKALATGYSDFKWLLEDPDLENLRSDPAFRRIHAKLKAIQIKTV